MSPDMKSIGNFTFATAKSLSHLILSINFLMGLIDFKNGKITSAMSLMLVKVFSITAPLKTFSF
jgi:hypothetical protein